MANKGEKQYGLIIPKKQQAKPPKTSNVFGDEGDSDEDDGTDWVKKALKAESEKNKMKKQTKLNMQKALKEDPTIYQYDEVYDDMERTKSQTKAIKQEEKKPKYIQNLLKAAERRKKEQEHRIERMVQKEREAEGSMYADKESFVTSAYRAKLEEFKQMEEEEARMSRLEAIGDVTKQQDMSGFYRHLYEQTVDNPKQSENNHENDKTEMSSKNDERIDQRKDTDTEGKDTNLKPNTAKEEHSITVKTKKSRQYRQRVIEADDSDSEDDSKPEVHNKDGDSLPTKSKDAEKADAEEPEIKRRKQDIEHNGNAPNEVDNKVTTEAVPASNEVETVEDNKKGNDNSKSDKDDAAAKEKIELAKKERSRIWEKRTVGPIFDAALQRYYTRKAMRQAAT